jgi:uncharacterized membrane-anchored protein YjiN (DUF445 family)
MQLSNVTPFNSQFLPEDANRPAELRKMKFIATALLAVAFIIFVGAKMFEVQAVWIGFVRATAEAAMVGALADWFAVTALFRYPLGLKIPHTAIVPNRKEEIGENLGRFVRYNFLSGEVIADKLRSMDITRRVVRWLSQPHNSQLIANHVAEAAAAALQVMDDEDIQSFIEQSAEAQIRAVRFAPVLGNLLSMLTSDNRKRELWLATANLGARFLSENRAAIEERIRQETPWWLPRQVDHRIYQKIVEAYDRTFQEVSAKPNHPLYQNFSDTIDRFVEELKNSPDVLAKEEAIKEELLQQPIARDFSASMWADFKIALVEQASDPNSSIRNSIQHGLVRFGETVLTDPTLLEKIDRWVENAALYLIEKYGYEVEHLISHTINRWDAQDAARRIELYVGKDLQFIRINGTVVGGLAGLAIHAFSLLF